MRDFKSNLLVDMPGSNRIFPFDGMWAPGTHTGTGRDVQWAENAIVSVWLLIGLATYVIVKLQESDDNSTWADLPATKYGTKATPAGMMGDYYAFFTASRFKRYLRGAIIVAGGAPDVVLTHVALDRAKGGPASQWHTEI